MMLSNITVPLLGLVDTAIMGHLSEAYYLGAVALGSTLFTLIVWLLGFLRMATTGLTAQAWGSGHGEAQKRILLQGLTLALGAGVLVLLVQDVMLDILLGWSDASAAVLLHCRDYFAIRIWSLPLALANLVMLGWLLGRQQPRVAMWQLILANLVNIVLDFLFVFGFGWGVKGAALASVMAELCAFSIAVFFTAKAWRALDCPSPMLRDILANLAQLLRLNRDIFVRSLCLQATFAFMTFKGAGLGDNTVAANAVLLNFLMLTSYALDGLAYYAEAETGAAVGRSDPVALDKAVALAFGWSAIFACLFSGGFALWGEWLTTVMTDIAPVQQLANSFLPWLIAMPLLAFGSYLFDGVYIGATQGRVMRNSMLLATLGVFFPLWWGFADWGNHALWLAMSGFMLCRSLSLGWHFVRHRQGFLS
ncbi:MATE family efflux transporter [Shewanella litorisediminis]|uniref:MATE family efflux transporter n=2 Tax=Shewanella litorisediminis TaxID=1173586 RepID=A0ABX7G8N4_9GAMM|nr:MATE family efflux transporter [Shewanella litorisediminis]MCL2917239.1 MATE family efflux transporter [Shewanella litorisediminis]QRH03724.1 MATE family efflux transporter [Shewanella litorisediminis]